MAHVFRTFFCATLNIVTSSYNSRVVFCVQQTKVGGGTPGNRVSECPDDNIKRLPSQPLLPREFLQQYGTYCVNY